MAKRILGVGNCSFDHGNLERLITAHFEASLVAAALPATLAKLRADRFDLVLVNRRLEYDPTEGVALIEQIKADPQLAEVPVMLLSDYAWAQEAAVAIGAEPGFGKAELEYPTTLAKLAAILAP